jgi:hypothetical protein
MIVDGVLIKYEKKEKHFQVLNGRHWIPARAGIQRLSLCIR